MTKNLNNFEGIEIETFTNGKEIKDYLKATPEETAIFLFLDLRMPVMTGFEFLDWYEQNRTHKNLKIYVVSSTLKSNEIEQAKHYGCVEDFIEKPITADRLQSILQLPLKD